VIQAVAPAAVAVKLQVAFYERFGLEGMRAYAQTIREARAAGLIVIGDVKRGDIGSTAEAYAMAHLPGPQEAAWEGEEQFHVDAVTVNPLLGSDGVLPFVERAARSGCGVFALVKTSNPSSSELQHLECSGRPLYERLGELVERWGLPHVGRRGYSVLGAVVGATFPAELERLRGVAPHAPFLVPGYGAQGAGVREALPAFDTAGLGAIVSSSRGIIYAYERSPYVEQFGRADWQEAVRAAAECMRRGLWLATHGAA